MTVSRALDEASRVHNLARSGAFELAHIAAEAMDFYFEQTDPDPRLHNLIGDCLRLLYRYREIALEADQLLREPRQN